ncbi:type III-B CRISPR module-associated protein Cmr5 [Candidatus Roizmanbacteria bacterium]|nr:type III-B CRISPR module-associated protein Cmr5 [Candidatus Roizmanbacteria bacterium]
MHNIPVPCTAVFKGFARDRQTGNEKPFGFLAIRNSDDLFIHASVLGKAGIPQEEQIKELEVELLSVIETEKGLKAEKIRMIGVATSAAPVTVQGFPLPQETGISFTGEAVKVAYACAENGLYLTGKKKEYKNTVKSLPMMIRLNGLAPTLVYLACHEKEPYQRIYAHLAGRLSAIEQDLTGDTATKIRDIQSDKLRKITLEAVSFLGWIKRFSSGLIPD